MLSEIKVRTLKAHQPPGSLVYTGEQPKAPSIIHFIRYTAKSCEQKTVSSLSELSLSPVEGAVTWIHIQGLHDIPLMEQIAQQFQIHPLTLEDILNVEQRPKIEEFDNYIFITLKSIQYTSPKNTIPTQNLNLILGKDFVLSFQDEPTDLFDPLRDRISRHPDQWVKKSGSDYLAYRLIDITVDSYFFVLEKMNDQLETIENLVITNPTKRNAQGLYQLKNKVLTIRKIIWPLREILTHLLNVEGNLISSNTKLYLRDVQDHISQAIDIVDTFRDMLSNLLDVFLSYLSYRMNEVMKVLTVITTIFIPITFIASIYGMNFKYMPELQWRWSYPICLFIMAVIALLMLYYYRRKKWL